MNNPLHPWRNFSADRDSQRRVPLIISLLAFLFSMMCMSLLAQTRTAHTAPAGTHRDLSASLSDLERVAQATDNDIAGLHAEKWGASWTRSILRGKDQQQVQAQQQAVLLQRNLRSAMPDLIHDAQNARGSLSATFKLYDNLSVVCQALDSLISTAESKGKKDDAAPLNQDYNALVALRRELSSYIQTAAVAVESKGRMPGYGSTSASSGYGSGTHMVTGPGGVKRIVVDDAVPEPRQKSAKAVAPRPAAPKPAAVPVLRVANPAPTTKTAAAPAARVTAPAAAPAANNAPAPSRPAVVASSDAAAAPAPVASPTPKKKATLYYTN